MRFVCVIEEVPPIYISHEAVDRAVLVLISCLRRRLILLLLFQYQSLLPPPYKIFIVYSL